MAHLAGSKTLFGCRLVQKNWMNTKRCFVCKQKGRVFPNAVRVVELFKLWMLWNAGFASLYCTVRWMTWNWYWNTQLRLENYSSSLLVAYLTRSDGSFQPYNIEANSKFRLRTRNAEAFGSLCLVKMPFLFPPTRVMAEIK